MITMTLMNNKLSFIRMIRIPNLGLSIERCSMQK